MAYTRRWFYERTSTGSHGMLFVGLYDRLLLRGTWFSGRHTILQGKLVIFLIFLLIVIFWDSVQVLLLGIG